MLELLGQLRVARSISIKVNDSQTNTMLHFAFAQLMYISAPPPIMLQSIRHMLAQQNVSGITAIHDSLGDVDPGPGDIRLRIQIRDLVNRAAMNPHSHLEFGMAG